MEMEVVVATQPSSVREMGNIKGRRAWARGGAHFQDMSLRGQVELCAFYQRLSELSRRSHPQKRRFPPAALFSHL